MKKIVFLVCILLMVASVSFAENVYLKDGTVIRDVRIIGRNSYAVMVVGHGRIFNKDIERIGDDIQEEVDGEDQEAEEVEEAKGVEEMKGAEEVGDKDGMKDKSKDELILELFVVNGMKETVDNNIASLNKQLPEDKKEELKKIVNAKELLGSLVPVYDKNFSKEEIIDLIKFYRSSAGAKLLKDTPKLMEQIMIATVDYYKAKIKKNQEDGYY